MVTNVPARSRNKRKSATAKDKEVVQERVTNFMNNPDVLTLNLSDLAVEYPDQV